VKTNGDKEPNQKRHGTERKRKYKESLNPEETGNRK